MNFNEYLEKHFVSDLKEIDGLDFGWFKIQSGVVSFRKNEEIIVPEQYQNADWTYFFMNLFILASIDYIMFSYFGIYYYKYSRYNKRPQFVWSGKPTIDILPKEIIHKAVASNLLKEDVAQKSMNEIIDSFKTRIESIFGNKIIEIPSSHFMRVLHNDWEMCMDKEGLFYEISNLLK